MLMNLLLLLGGLVLLIKGGDWFVAAAIRLAEFLRVPRVVVGSTLVSLATTTPELVVSVISGLRGESGLAVGNAVGSVICNIGLILGITGVLKRVEITWRKLLVPLTVMLGLGLYLLLGTMDLKLARSQGWLLVGIGLAYFIADFFLSYRNRRRGDLQEANAIESELGAEERFVQTRTGAVSQFLGGAVVVVIGAKLLVDGAVGVAAALRVPSIVVGLTVVAVGTSLPELVTAVTSARRNVSDLSVGNVLGANIANLSFIVGSAAIFQELTVSRLIQLFNLPAMLLLMGLLTVFLATRGRLARSEGLILLAGYAAYLLTLVILTVAPG